MFSCNFKCVLKNNSRNVAGFIFIVIYKLYFNLKAGLFYAIV